jgi:hypothetical protein
VFEERIKDIKSWTMSSDIFEIWPEFLSDMPVFNPMLQTLPLGPPSKLSKSSSSWALVSSNHTKPRLIFDNHETPGRSIDEESSQHATLQAIDFPRPVQQSPESVYWPVDST